MGIKLQSLETDFKINAGGANAVVAGLTAGIATLVAGIGVAVGATFKWADDLDGLQDVMGGTNAQVAALNFTARKSKVGVDTLTKGMTILEKGLVKADGTLDVTGKSLKKWGISVKDTNGKLKDQTQLIKDITTKYSSFSTAQERVNFLTEVFGKSGAGLVDFFDTLSKDGGLDAVTKKVQAFGLAIDPGRYEQFSRNLEEIKLMGLGLAVSLTERLMPTLERFTNWMSNTAIPDFLTFKRGLLSAFDTGGIDAALTFLDTKIAGIIDNIDWAGMGDKLGDKVQELFTNGLTNGANSVDVPLSLQAISHGIDIFFQNATGASAFGGWKAFFNAWGVQIREGADRTFNGIELQVKVFFTRWELDWTLSLRNWGISLEKKLTDISKSFFNAGGKWINQAVAGFNDHKNELFSAISALVGQINSILKKIITSFSITIKLPFGLGGTPTVSTGTTGGSSTGGGGGGVSGKRATGGNVIGGQSYNVVELNKPEVFTPNTSGRIEPKSNKPVIAIVDAKEFAREYAREMKQFQLKAV